MDYCFEKFSFYVVLYFKKIRENEIVIRDIERVVNE